MAHLRKQIRDRIESNLTGLTQTGTNVFTSRVYMLQEGQLPALSIYTNEESVNIADSTPGGAVTYDRELIVTVTCHVRGNDTSDDSLDQVITEVEHAMAGDADVNSLALSVLLQDINIEMDSGDQPVLMATMDYVIRYRTLETDVENAA